MLEKIDLAQTIFFYFNFELNKISCIDKTNYKQHQRRLRKCLILDYYSIECAHSALKSSNTVFEHVLCKHFFISIFPLIYSFLFYLLKN